MVKIQVMDNNNVSLKTIIIACVVLAILITAFIFIYIRFLEKPAEGEKNITVDIIVADKIIRTYEIKTDAEFLREALESNNLVSGNESEMGLFVLTVDCITVNESNQEWWCFTKNGEMLNTGIDTTPVYDGDHFEITLTIGW